MSMLPLPALPTINQDAAKEQGKTGWGKFVSALLSAAITTFLMNYASLHGFNFKALGIPSEYIKSLIDAIIIAGSVWLTPSHLVAAAKDFIIWCRLSWRTLYKAATDPLP